MPVIGGDVIVINRFSKFLVLHLELLTELLQSGRQESEAVVKHNRTVAHKHLDVYVS